jgi:hypothetical protein
MLKWLSSNPNDHFSEIERLVQERVAAWRAATIETEDRMIALFGYPGIGKTFLLNYLAKKYEGVVIDLKERFKYTPHQFVNLTLERLRPKVDKSDCFMLLDNVPSTQDDDQILEFERGVLLPYWRGGALICQCQIRTETVWSQRVPHVIPISIPGLSQKGLKDLRVLHNCQPKHSEAEAILFSAAEHIPLLVKQWCASPVSQQNLESVLHQILIDWWKSVSDGDLPDNSTSHLRLFAFQSCANKQDYATMKKMIDKAGLLHDYAPLDLETKLRTLLWLKSSSVWYEPMSNILQTWLFLKEPENYRAIKNGG